MIFSKVKTVIFSFPKEVLIALFLAITIVKTYPQTPNWDWVNLSHGGLSPYGGKFYVDQDSSIYVSMSVHNEWHADSFSIYQQPQDHYDADLVVWKLNESGNTEWLHTYGTNWMDRNGDIRRDENHDLYIECKIDRFGSNLQLDTLTGGDYRFYIDEQGTWLKAEKAPGKFTQRDARGRTLKIGRLGTGDTLIFGTDTILGNPIGTIPIYPDHYIAMIDSVNGNYWGKIIGDFESQLPIFLRFLDENSILLVGRTQRRARMQACSPTYKEGIFWVLFDSLGNCINYHSIDAVEPGLGGIAINNQKEFFILGRYATSLSFGGKTWNSGLIYGSNFFVMKVDSQGSAVWVNSTENSQAHVHANKIVQDLNGNMIIGGYTIGEVPIEHLTIGKDSVQDIFLCSFDPHDGKLQWTKGSDTQKSQAPPGSFFQWGHIQQLAISPLNHLYMLGSFITPTYTLGPHVLQYRGSQNIFVASLNLNKTKAVFEELAETCPVHIHYSTFSNTLLIRDECPDQPIVDFTLYALSGQKVNFQITENEGEKGYELQPVRFLPVGMYILKWHRRNGVPGGAKIVVAGN